MNTKAIKLKLPWPPSVNHYWGSNGNRRFIRKKGIEYRNAVERILAKRLVKRMTGRLSIVIAAYPPDRRKRDLDNLQKALFDSLAKGGLYSDDSQIDYFSVQRCSVCKPGRMEIIVSEI